MVLCSEIDRFSPLMTISIIIDDYSPKKKPQRLACGHLFSLQTPVLHCSGIMSVRSKRRFPTLALPRSGSKGCHHCDSVTWSLSASHTPSGMAKHSRPPIYLQASPDLHRDISCHERQRRLGPGQPPVKVQVFTGCTTKGKQCMLILIRRGSPSYHTPEVDIVIYLSHVRASSIDQQFSLRSACNRSRPREGKQKCP